MESIDLNELACLAKAATPGPWTVDDDCYRKPHYSGNGAVWIFADHDCETHPIADCSCNHTCRMEHDQQANAAYIAAVNPSAVLELIARLRTAEALLSATISPAAPAESSTGS